MIARWILIASGLVGFTAIVAGTFGAHFIPFDTLDPDAPQWWETAAKMHLAHAPVLLGLALLYAHRPSRFITASAICFVVGVIVFTGSLYVMSLTGLRWLGAITPIGGVALLAGWALVVAVGLRRATTTPGPKTTPGH